MFKGGYENFKLRRQWVQRHSTACLEKDKKFGVKNLGELKEVEGSEAGDKVSAMEISSKPW